MSQLKSKGLIMFDKKNQKKIKYLSSPINTPMLNYNCYFPTLMEKMLYFTVSFIGGGAASLIFFSGFFKSDGQPTVATYICDVVIFIVAGFIVSRLLYSTFLDKRKEKRDKQLRNQFRDLLDSLSASFSSGVNSTDAFKTVYEDMVQQHGVDSYIAIETREILDGVNQNVSISQMLKSFSERSGNEDIENFANVYDIALQKGSDLKTVIRRTHGIISDRIEVNDEIQTKLASNKLQHTVMTIMPIGIVAILRLTNESMANSFATPLGVVVNIIAVLMFIGSYILGQKICDIK